MSKNTVKVTVELDSEFWQRVYTAVPFGMRKRLLVGITRMLLDSLEREGDIMIGAVMSGQCRLVLDLERKEDNVQD